ncbi:hypothetical protein F2Q70_00042601 [Brassica cretica]|uniref:Uncharacterized protein n=1 Tax=Brassica cretica TaxID=69181 RepID=A0A8S9KHI7_BRACR|nr:hypothetical protein F2Q70_00042601 [Brassica cretica]
MTNRGCKAGYVPGGAEGRSLRNIGCHFQQIYEATNCSLHIGREKMAMYGSVLTPVWCNGDGHDNFFSDINKPAAVNCIEGHDIN